MTLRQSGKVYVPATSFLGSQSATLSMAADWADGDGWWNGLLRGSISFGDYEFAMRNEPISTRRSWCWVVS